MEQELQEAVAAAKLSAVRSGMSLKTLVGMVRAPAPLRPTSAP